MRGDTLTRLTIRRRTRPGRGRETFAWGKRHPRESGPCVAIAIGAGSRGASYSAHIGRLTYRIPPGSRFHVAHLGRIMRTLEFANALRALTRSGEGFGPASRDPAASAT